MSQRLAIALASGLALASLRVDPVGAGEMRPSSHGLLSPARSGESYADRRSWGWRERRPRWRDEPVEDRRAVPETYLLAKGGGIYIQEADKDGLYLGLEFGGELQRVLDVGLSVDYFHRRTRDLQVLFDSNSYELPIHGDITNFESSADLVPLGATMRVRLPIGSDAVTPFISGTLAYEILHLGLFQRNAPPRPYSDLLGDSETFTGFGWQAAAGVQIAMSPAVGLFGEVGLHRSSPSQSVELNGVPVDLRVRLDGGFLRAGVRVAM